MEKRQFSKIVTIDGKQYLVLQSAGQISERYSFEEWERGQAKIRDLFKADKTDSLSPAEKALLKKRGL